VGFVKLEFYQTMIYSGPDHGDSWPAPPRLSDPAHTEATMANGLDQCGQAYDVGFDSLNFAEHHYSPKQLTPNPIVYAGVCGRRYPGANIGVFGTDLPLNNPVRIAEEYSMLDNMLGGNRLRFGLLRGTPNEYITYGSNPWESRARFDEAALLMKACFVEPEPFGWDGRYYRYRNIAVWPRVVQDPHPRILMSGNSMGSATFAGKHGFDIGFSYMAPELCLPNLNAYKAAAAEAGWTPTADNITYRHFMYVAENAQEAADTFKASEGRGLMSIFNGATPDMMKNMMTIGAALGGLPKHVPLDPTKAPPPMVVSPAVVGTPDQAIARAKEIHDVLGNGRLEVSMGAINPLPHEVTMRTLKLIGQEVIDVLHKETW
jgi:alkanesulfonate monooxygenase SsuD/methylene tetrahydromethanopterin reductase-like flavin-dependent oxidoreductase (luciferase family)